MLTHCYDLANSLVLWPNEHELSRKHNMTGSKIALKTFYKRSLSLCLGLRVGI